MKKKSEIKIKFVRIICGCSHKNVGLKMEDKVRMKGKVGRGSKKIEIDKLLIRGCGKYMGLSGNWHKFDSLKEFMAKWINLTQYLTVNLSGRNVECYAFGPYYYDACDLSIYSFNSGFSLISFTVIFGSSSHSLTSLKLAFWTSLYFIKHKLC